MNMKVSLVMQSFLFSKKPLETDKDVDKLDKKERD